MSTLFIQRTATRLADSVKGFTHNTLIRRVIRASAKPSGYGFGVLLTLLCQLAVITPAQAVQDTITTYQYDANGNLTGTVSPLSSTSNPVATRYFYDGLDRLQYINQSAPSAGLPHLPSIALDHDGQDRLTWVSDPRGNATGYTITGLGDTTAANSPDTGATSNTYDAAGNLKTSTDARGKTATYSYDALGRLTRIDYATGIDTTFTYDGGTGNTNAANVGKLTRMDDEAGYSLYSYNALARLVAKTQNLNGSQTAWSKTVSYAYGSSGTATSKLASLTYPSGLRVNYGYDTAGRINNLTYNPANANGIGTNTALNINLLTGIQYSPTGQFLSGVFGNHTTANPNLLTRAYDLDGRITQYPLGQSQNGGTVRTLSYDPASRITAMTHTGSGTGAFLPANFNQSVNYDNLGRIIQFTGPGGSISYSYDNNHNRISKGADSYTVDAFSNKLLKTSPAAVNRLYDAAGNLLDDGATLYTYSDRGRLQSAKNKTTNAITTYTYDGLNQRISKTGLTAADSGLSHYVYDEAGHLLGEYNSYGRAAQETVYLGNMPVAVFTQSYGTNAATAIVTDNTDAANVTSVGTWTPDTTVTGYQGSNYQTHAKLTAASTDSFTWKLTLAPGKYYIQARWTADATRASNAVITVTDPDGTSTRSVDQRSSGNTWVNLGTKTITAAGTPVTVKLSPSLTGTVSADAVQALPITATAKTYYVFADHLDAPRVITQATDNKMAWRWDNADPFGTLQPNPNPAGLTTSFTYHLRFPGQHYDSETGLSYNMNRSYDASAGSYTTSDPIGLNGGINTYAYVGGNPVNFTDPLGLSPIDKICKLIPSCKAAAAAAAKKIWDVCKKLTGEADDSGTASQGRPTTRVELEKDLLSKGYTKTGTSPEGYTTYKGPDGRTVTVKPTGEVIPTQRVWKQDGSGKFPQRQDYEGNPLSDQSHSTGHNVEPFDPSSLQ